MKNIEYLYWKIWAMIALKCLKLNTKSNSLIICDAFDVKLKHELWSFALDRRRLHLSFQHFFTTFVYV